MTVETVEVGNYKIALNTPLTYLDMPNAQAYKVTCSSNPEGAFYALLCGAHPVARFDKIETYTQSKLKNVQELVAAEVVAIDPVKKEHAFALIYKQPAGNRILAPGKDSCEALPISELKVILEGALDMLESFAESGLTHRAIRPDNIFWADTSKTGVVFGDCLSVPPGYDQPIVFEPLSRSMCSPAGRGEGNIESDLYALGVSLLTLAVGQTPLKNISDKEITFRRLEHGNYQASTKGLTVPRNIFDLIQGLLIEESADRWRIEDVRQWQINKCRLPKPKRLHPTSTKPLTVGNDKVYSARGMNWAIRNNWEVAHEVLSQEAFQYWIRQDLQDQDLLEEVNETFKTARTAEKGDTASKSEFICNVCMVLNPTAPIYWDGFSCMIDGIGHLLAEYMAEDRDLKPISEMIMAKIPYIWMSCQEELPHNAREIVRQFERVRMFLVRSAPGYGIDRVAYTLAPGLPCLARPVRKAFVRDPLKLLEVLEANSPKPGEERDLFDLNLVAYLATHYPYVTERELNGLNEKDAKVKGLAKLTILSMIQRQTGPKKTPHLSTWLAPAVKPCLEAYQNVQLKEQLYREFEDAVPQGDLSKLIMVVDNNVALEKDRVRFKRAIRDYQMLRFEADKLRGQLKSKTFILGKGRELAAKLTAGISSIFILAYLLVTYIV